MVFVMVRKYEVNGVNALVIMRNCLLLKGAPETPVCVINNAFSEYRDL